LASTAAVFRRATASDIDRLIEIRSTVRENRLSNPMSVTRADYDRFVGEGRVWVGEVHGTVAGFSAGDERDGTIWALFVDAAYQGAGIGPMLLSKACLDLKNDGYKKVRLTTQAGTRAERLYRKLGWIDVGISDGGEMRFELAF
jgi:ribosomal protein S18 acetylase RimI-like enzyme